MVRHEKKAALVTHPLTHFGMNIHLGTYMLSVRSGQKQTESDCTNTNKKNPATIAVAGFLSS
jgi:hypothetical protein